MPDEAGIYWLASYPKSGNTWFRVFLAHILHPSGEALALDSIRTGAIASARSFADDALGFDSALLSHDELDDLRPFVYAWQGAQATKPQYHKIHDAYTYLPDGRALIPSKQCLGALYFIRNPLDVVVSFANHASCSIDEAIQKMEQPDYAFCSGAQKQHDQLRQRLLSWSMHVTSWQNATDINTLVIRYEDMKANPVKTFTKATHFLNIKATDVQIKQAVSHSDMSRLQQLEAQNGFKEKPPKAKAFFRKGIVGDWKNHLSPAQVNRVIAHHADVMKTYGYLTP